MQAEEWIFPPELTTIRVGTRRLAWEERARLDETLDGLRRDGLADEVARDPRFDGYVLACPGRAAAARAVTRLGALGLAIELALPRHGLRESVGAAVTARGRYVRQAGAEQFGIVDLRLTPLPGAAVVRYRCELPPDGPISAEFLPAVARGVRRAALIGGPRGYPLAGLAVTLVGGVEHPVDSRSSSFEIAAIMAMRQALEEAGVLLAPVPRGDDGPRKG